MNLVLTNSLGNKRELFIPLTPGRVGMYHCGPTVTEALNLHKFRSYLLADLLRRTFECSGFEVLQVMNITDVGHLNEFEEDVIEIAAARSGKLPWELADEEIGEFHSHREALRILPAHHYPQAREHVEDMVRIVERFLQIGAAYHTERNVYLDITKCRNFGCLKNMPIQELEALQKELVQKVPEDKRHPLDIDLWRTDVLHHMHWHSPWGLGFPGWHVECVAMGHKYLGDTFDIHTGSEDTIFPHHECEIAQAETLTSKPLARYWLHSAQVLIDGKPISRKNQNRLTVQGLLDQGLEGPEIRCALLNTHYRKPLEFDLETIEVAQAQVGRWKDATKALEEAAGSEDPDAQRRREEADETFQAALDDDLDFPRALEVAIDMAEDFATGKLAPSAQTWEAVKRYDRVLGLLDQTD